MLAKFSKMEKLLIPYKIFLKVFWFCFVNFSIYIKFKSYLAKPCIVYESNSFYFQCLRIEQFLLSIENSNFDDLFDDISEFQSAITDEYLNVNEVMIKWNQCMDLAKEFIMFLDTVVPVLKDLTHSFREIDWCLQLSAVKKITPLFFSF